MAPSAHPVIPRDTLLEAGRVTRPPLRTWVAELNTKLDRAAASDPASWLDVAGCMNNAALIEVFRSQRQSARELCELQLRWVENLARVHGLTATGALAPQPWVNIGRLLRIEGNGQGSRAHFSFLLDTRAMRAVHFGPITMDADTWQDVVRANALLPFLEAVYVVDSVKSYFADKDYVGALDFLDEARQLVTKDGTLAMLHELEVIALATLGRYDDAMVVTERPEWLRDGYSKLVRVTYRVALTAAATPGESTRKLIEQLASRVLAGGLVTPSDQRVLRYLHYFGVLARHAGMPELAERIWRQGVRASRHLVDAFLELAFLESLLELEALDTASDNDTSGTNEDINARQLLAVERDTLLRKSLYTCLLRPRGLATALTAADTAMFTQLRARLEQVAASPLSALSTLAEADQSYRAAAAGTH